MSNAPTSSTMSVTTSPAAVSRRRFLVGASAAGVAGVVAPRMAFSTPGNPGRGDVLVYVFLRGGMDSLSAIVPFGDDRYYELRPTIAVPPPDPADRTRGALDLGGGFGLHPAMAPLYDGPWTDGNLAAIVAAGLPTYESPTRSHFDAQVYIEAGSASALDGNGWIARHLVSNGVSSSVEGIGIGNSLQASLRGQRGAIAVSSPDSFGLDGWHWSQQERARDSLNGLYPGDSGAGFLQLGRDTLDVLDLVASAEGQPTEATYPGDNWRTAAWRDAAKLIKANLGIQAICIDEGGWDTHTEMGAFDDENGSFRGRVSHLGNMLTAFAQDLGSGRMQEVTVVVQSEFGRTIGENGDFGTDHGRAGCLLVMGGGINGGLYGSDVFPGVVDDPEDDDLSVAIDYRRVLGEVLRKRLDNGGVGTVFPTYTHDAGAELGVA